MEQQLQAGGIKRHTKNATTYTGRKATHYWFTVIANNNKILVTSETYRTKQAMEKGIASLKIIIGSHE